MELNQLKAQLLEAPFRPFTIHMVDGRTFHIPHPDWVWIPPNTRHTAVVASKEHKAAMTIDVALVSRLAPDQEKPDVDGNGNGHSRPRRKKP